MTREASAASSSDDEDAEEECSALVPQNDTKTLHNRHYLSPSSSAAALEVGDLPCRASSRRLPPGKPYLIAICIVILVVLLFIPLGRLFLSGGFTAVAAPYSPSSSGGELIREAELRALYLLRNQQAELLKLWDRTLTASTAAPIPAPGNAAAPSSSSSFDLPKVTVQVPLDELRSVLLRQIKLNKQIQNTLLASHRVGNTSSEFSDENSVLDVSGSADINVCKNVDRPKDRRTIEWKPKKDKYLFAICLSGQMSNHLICLEKHMFFAALLGRFLVLPSPKFDYQYDRVLDLEHINECFGRKVVVSFEEFARTKKNKIKIDTLICYMASPPCYLDEEHIKRLKNLGISLGKIDAAWPEEAKLKTPKKKKLEDVIPKFSSNDELIAIGDMFYADVEEEWVMQPGGPLAHKCKTLIQPSKLIYATAQRFVQTFLGNNFIALHFRRHGFLKFCNAKKESCFFPIPQAAECILHVAEKANAPVIYLSTDAAESETNLLQSLVVLGNKQIPLVRRPNHNSAEKWDSLLFRNHLDADNQVEAMLDKTICALSNVFIGASGSTFTEDIIRLRRGWESASACDEYLCQGQLPNYIAENQ